MKVYFVDIHGNVHEYEIVNPHEEKLQMRPQDGCDMLIRDSRGCISSAKRVQYRDTPQEALRAFLERQQQYIDQAQAQLDREKASYSNAAINYSRLPWVPPVSKEISNA